MQALWLYLKENVNFGCKLTDVVTQSEKCSHQKSCIANDKREEHNEPPIPQVRDPFGQVITGQPNSRTEFCELNIGDPTRNIIEMIFQRASAIPSKPVRTISRVIRVKNSIETLEIFESYREKVKQNAKLEHNERQYHPRSTVDGYELLRFYGTTISCCNDQNTIQQVTNPCRFPTCGVCRAIQSNFNTAYTKKRSGVCLSAKSEELSDNTIAFKKVKKIERAVILCRAIAGTVEKEACEANDSELIIPDPCAVLPCFIVVFN